jgi:putative drug exporter of the RND superfamily
VFGWLGRTVVRHPWWTIVAWLVAAVAVIGLAPKMHTSSDQTDFLPSKYESVQASHLADKAFPSTKDKTDPEIILVKRTDGQPLTSADQRKVGEVAKALKAKNIPQVVNVLSGPQTLAKDHSSQLITVPMPTGNFNDDKTEKKNETAVKQLRTDAADQFRGSDLQYGVTGDVATQVDNSKSQNDSMAIVGIATIVLIIVLILAIFRSPIAAILPILLIGVVLEVANSMAAIVGNTFNLDFDAGNSTLILVVLYGIGTDYLLFLLFRYRERLRAGEDKKTAMITTVTRVGEAIASAAGAVIVAFLVLLLANFKSFGSLGPQLAIAVAVMLVTALTIIPAIVSLLGRFVFWPSKAWKKQPTGSVWAKLGGAIGRRPGIAALGSGVLLIVLAAGALGFKADYDFTASFPQNTESAKAMNDLKKSFPAGTLTPTEVYVESGTPLSKSTVASYQRTLATAPGVGQVVPAEFNPDRTVAKINLYLKDNPNSNEAIDLVKGPLRDFVHKTSPPGTKALVGGQTAAFADINSVNNRDLSVILPVAVVLIALILALLLRSLVAPVYLAVAVLLGFTATLGASVALFQGIEGKSGLMFNIPIVLYLFVLAIGTDYNILMIARLREEAREGNDPRTATTLAVQHAGPTVAAAGLILAGTFGTLALSPISMIAQIGFGVAIGIVLSAFVVSTFFVPALTALIGHTAWWPGHADRARNDGSGPPAEEPYELAGRPN